MYELRVWWPGSRTVSPSDSNFNFDAIRVYVNNHPLAVPDHGDIKIWFSRVRGKTLRAIHNARPSQENMIITAQLQDQIDRIAAAVLREYALEAEDTQLWWRMLNRAEWPWQYNKEHALDMYKKRKLKRKAKKTDVVNQQRPVRRRSIIRD